MKIDNHLEMRSSLLFQFYDGQDRPVEKLCEFMENIRVREQSSSKLATYTPIGRNGSVYVHLGSDSRKFSVEFNLTLPHIMEHTPSVDIDESPMERYERRKADRQAYFNGGSQMGPQPKIETYEDHIRQVDRLFESYLDPMESIQTKLKALGEGALSLITNSSDPSPRIEAIKSVLFWMNLIRSSTLTHSKRPHYGPPLIRLNHGIVYQNVPCIATNYSINIDGQAGYDNRTLLPRVIKVTLNLSEVRLSSAADFDPNGNVRQEYDQNVGWEVIADKIVSYNRITLDSIQTSSLIDSVDL